MPFTTVASIMALVMFGKASPGDKRKRDAKCGPLCRLGMLAQGHWCGSAVAGFNHWSHIPSGDPRRSLACRLRLLRPFEHKLLLFPQECLLVGDQVAKFLRCFDEASKRLRLQLSGAQVLLVDNDAAQQRPTISVGIFTEVAQVFRHWAPSTVPRQPAVCGHFSVADVPASARFGLPLDAGPAGLVRAAVGGL